MKTTIDIPDKELAEALKHTRAKTKREAVVTAVAHYNRLKRLEALNARVRGKFKNFITRKELDVLREADRREIKL